MKNFDLATNDWQWLRLLTPIALVLCALLFAGNAAAEELSVTPGSWSPWQRESDASYVCANNEVIIAREHRGDENGDTRYRCGSLSEQGVSVTYKDATWSDAIKESDGTSFTCADRQVMVGRKHRGDENGNTQYECATPVDDSGKPLIIRASEWSVADKESRSAYVCPSNSVMVGRMHQGDENGGTTYRCAQLF